MNIINNGNSFLLLKYRLTFAAGIKNKIDVMNAIIGKKELTVSNKNLSHSLGGWSCFALLFFGVCIA